MNGNKYLCADFKRDMIMLERKFTQFLEHFLMEETNKILLVNGARQIGKSYLIRHVGKKLFTHFVEINLKEKEIKCSQMSIRQVTCICD